MKFPVRAKYAYTLKLCLANEWYLELNKNKNRALAPIRIHQRVAGTPSLDMNKNSALCSDGPVIKFQLTSAREGSTRTRTAQRMRRRRPSSSF
ncbi:hypothetical protein EXIGLDRAFT_756850 [Exidia glandulosa HHB12029]|uniref:Uncharacterized protein n=1 Tax=Exidia glandulosa HHB12029 TaxID=1314781 RepID=A0A165Z5R0_EXIGL|nr:hypothetical protein EXIGLDRAFT_756850 [Exidia glandulosa HHB12029]